ncbi:MAG: universal stress protein [Candidatus Lokiarchaeota archaeon]|nr:universal stress protein [Candidatus Lokiarchaeota archaeon]
MYKNIVVGIDGSDHGAKALAHAVRMAREFKSNLHVFHAVKNTFAFPSYPLGIDPLHQQPVVSAVTQMTMNDYRRKEGERVIKQAMQQVKDMQLDIEGKVEYHLETSKGPADYAETYAKEHGADVIVLGCAGHHSRARKAFVGTVADHVMNNAPCNVLLVR